ncbi:MAG: phosphoenolpyruvate kinase, partial [Acidobacteriota bacterium]
MNTSLSPDSMKPIEERLQEANARFAQRYPGESGLRQPVHTVYGGAHLFKSDTAPRMGAMARQALNDYGADFTVLARALQLPGADTFPTTSDEVLRVTERLQRDAEAIKRESRATWFAWTIHRRVVEKLTQEPVEDFRIDFEDGYGNRSDAEEDGHAQAAASEVVQGMVSGTLPPYIGIRIKPLTEELRRRSLRTLDIFVSTVVSQTGGKLPANFVIMLPKVVRPEQVAALADVFDLLEATLALTQGTLKMEMMVETTQSIISEDGRSNLPLLLEAARGRCIAAHFGTYDYTASCSITAAHQHMLHPACDFARHMMQVAFGGTGIWLSDGATNIMPIAPHRPSLGSSLSPEQVSENHAVVHRAWKLHFDHIQHSLTNAFYQGWDLHPAQ